MKTNQKLKLNHLKVSSFITQLDTKSASTLHGGAIDVNTLVKNNVALNQGGLASVMILDIPKF